MNTLRVGVIGLGVGRQHAEAYHVHPLCQVTALCDFSAEQRAWANREYPRAKVTACAEDLIDDPEVDVVSIASYDDYHFEQAARALRRGKHVFVEKPVCCAEDEARELRSLLAARPGLVLSSNLILRRCPRFRWLKGQLVEGRLGRLFYMEGDYNYGRLNKITDGWRGRIENYSVVHGGAIHLVDLVTWLSGERVTSVTARANRIASEGTDFRYNDLTVALLEFERGLLAKVSANFGCVCPHFHNVTVFGTAGTFVNGRQVGLLYESRDPNTAPEQVPQAYPGVHKGGLIAGFVDAIVGGRPPEVTAEEVFDTMSVCLAIEDAARSGKSVAVRYV